MREWRAEYKKLSCVTKSVFSENTYHIVNINDCGVFKSPFTKHYASLLIHQCADTKDVYNHTSQMHPYVIAPDAADAMESLNAFRRCGLCKKPIPESVQTLWVLQNADVLHTDGDARYR